MNLFNYKYGDMELEFRLSNKAKVEIEAIQQKNQEEMLGDDPEAMIASMEYMSIEENKELNDEEKKARRKELLSQIAPFLMKTMKYQKGFDSVELMYILLHANPKFKDITKEKWEEIEYDIEEKMGFEEAMATFNEVSDKVFTVLERLNGHNQPQEPVKKEKKETKKKNLS
ncbi:hypothetical protein ACWG0P_14075 [Amedibacillus sp. YH-ame6]